MTMKTTKLRASSLTLLLVLPATVLLALSPTGAAGIGDTLLNGPTAVVPGNPCGAWGPAGGIAVKEAGTASALYYATRNVTKIHVSGAYMSGSPPACQGSITPAVPGTDGFQSLAYDAYHASVRLWAVRNNSATVHGLTLTGALVTSFTVPGVSQITGITVDEAVPHHLFLATGGSSVLRYSVAGTPTPVAPSSYPHGVSTLAAWGGALLSGDGGDWVRNHKVDGSWLGLLFHPGDTYIDPWWQPQRYHHFFDDVAYDEQTYAGVQKGALWGISTEGGYFCVAQCAVHQCVLYEGPQCIQWTCVQWCNPGDAILQYKVWPTIRAYEVKRTCPNGQQVPPTQECVCTAPVPQPTFTSPANAVLLRGVPTSPSAQPIVVQGSATVTAAGSSPNHVVTLRGPLPSGATVVGYGSASAAPLIASAIPRGAYTFEASIFDAALGCRGGTKTLTVWVEDPTSHTSAQALRIEGNIPLNAILGTIRAEPLDDLVGSESATVVDRQASGSLSFDLALLEANATHAPRNGAETLLEADARSVVLEGTLRIDLAALCFDVTGDPACAPLPTIDLRGEDLRAEASVGMELVTAQGAASSWVSDASTTRVTESLQGGSFDLTASPCPAGSCEIVVGGFRAKFADSWQRVDSLTAEAYAAALRIEIREGPYRGEIVVSEAYAGISLGGRDLLMGPTAFVEAQDDYVTGIDAPASLGPMLVPGAWSGQFVGDDRIDSFRVVTNVGQKLRVAIDPAHRVAAHLAPLPTAPAMLGAPRLLEVTLIAPDGSVRDRSTLNTLDAHPAFVELNVDLSGPWSVVVERIDTRDEAAPYTIAIEQRDVVLLPGDAADACMGAQPLTGPTTVASMGASDARDTYAISVAAGEEVTAFLQADDAEGADFDLRLLDGGCNVVAQSTLGKDPMPKGETDRLVAIPALPGTAFVQVVRVNGIGNYALGAQAHRAV